jgi:proteasome assembly chaperone (PAC2) family protein
VEFFKKLGGRRVYTIGGYSMCAQYVKAPKVFGLATDAKTVSYIKKQGVTPTGSTGMSVLGSAGMIVAFAKKHGLSAACIMGETGMLDVDANSAKAVLQVLGRMLGREIKMESIEKLSGETEKMLSELEAASGMQFPQTETGGFREKPGYIR